MRLLKLSEPVKAYIHSGKLSAGHARMLVGQPNAEELAEDIVARGLNVRQVETMARKSGQEQAKEAQAEAAHAARTPTPSRSKSACRTRSASRSPSITAAGGGVLHIHYSDLEQLDEVLRKLR